MLTRSHVASTFISGWKIQGLEGDAPQGNLVEMGNGAVEAIHQMEREKEKRKARKTKKGGELEMEMHLASVYPQEVTIGQSTKQSFRGGKATLRMRWH